LDELSERDFGIGNVTREKGYRKERKLLESLECEGARRDIV
jgi:hypothetical protein